ncbi:MAG: hypothetical protein Q8Q92_04845 [bacterium]|nr:hypothetical protein [bacterium]
MEPEQNNMNVGGGESSSGGSAGLIIGVIVILAIVILGGLYFWGQRANNSDAVTDTISTPSTSDEAAVIEADLNTTDIENLDAELNAS